MSFAYRLGTEELRLLRLIAERGPLSVREASEQFGSPTGVRLTTVGKMIERLTKKGLLERTDRSGAFAYRSTISAEKLLEGVVREFIQNSLGGSLAPFALYLAKGDIPAHELAELKRTVDLLSGEPHD